MTFFTSQTEQVHLYEMSISPSKRYKILGYRKITFCYICRYCLYVLIVGKER